MKVANNTGGWANIRTQHWRKHTGWFMLIKGTNFFYQCINGKSRWVRRVCKSEDISKKLRLKNKSCLCWQFEMY